MDYNKTPHACFRVKQGVGYQKELKSLLSKELGGNFGLFQSLLSAIFLSSGFTVEIEDKSFGVFLKKSRFELGEWILIVVPLSQATWPQLVRRRSSLHSLPQQKDLCRRIQSLLYSMPQVADVRWYFEGFDTQDEAVLTPDELTW